MANQKLSVTKIKYNNKPETTVAATYVETEIVDGRLVPVGYNHGVKQ